MMAHSTSASWPMHAESCVGPAVGCLPALHALAGPLPELSPPGLSVCSSIYVNVLSPPPPPPPPAGAALRGAVRGPGGVRALPPRHRPGVLHAFRSAHGFQAWTGGENNLFVWGA